MTPRELGGAISRAKTIFVWVPYGTFEDEGDDLEEDDDELEPGEAPPEPAPAPVPTVVVAEPTGEEEEPDPFDGIDGYWLQVTRVQARDVQARAIKQIEEEGFDVDIMAEDVKGDLYIGFGPLPE